MKTKKNSSWKKGQLFKGLVVRASGSSILYRGNHSIISDTNCIILMKENSDFLGSRFKGPMFHTVVAKKFSKVKSLFLNVY